MLKLKLVGVLAVFVITACNGIGTQTPRRVPGVIAFYGDPVEITVPASVVRGETFTVSVTTYGGGCIEQGGTDVQIAGLEAQVTPYDLDNSVPEYPCTSDLRFFAHTAELRFAEAGEA